MVPDTEDHARDVYGPQGDVSRAAARRGPHDLIAGTEVEMDPTRRLTGAE